MKRAAALASLLLVGGLAAGCSSDGPDPAAAPKDAGKGAFCTAYTSIMQDVTKTGDSADQLKRLRKWTAGLVKTGTPADISKDARAGFEKMMTVMNGLNEEDLKSLKSVESELTKEEKAQTQAFATYAQGACGDLLSKMQMPSPSVAPSAPASKSPSKSASPK